MAVDTIRLVNRVIMNQLGAAVTPDFGTADVSDVATDRYVDVALTNGTGAGQADRVYQKARTVTSGSNDDIDLNGGGLTDVFGVAVSFVKIKGLYIRSYDANTTNLTIGAAAATPLSSIWPATHTMILRPGACMQLIAGAADTTAYAVAAGANDVLRIANAAGASATYDIIVVGTSV